MQQTPDKPSEAPEAPFTPKFDATGLLTAIVVDGDSGAILMLAHMDKEALSKTRETGLAHFHSRSRGRLWMKGESSGNTLRVERILVDCDQDALVLECRPTGPACHTGAISCFYRELDGDVLRSVNT
ncbi:phosphoribosyl-AMP cyclohydrolase [Tsuneonella dongtanensis]|uniref:Histidine biosynthesis bifunctional protein HisIE n=1 Tax=Tsuneonella dongtanensis TaxID=692370 RepID=A0A1B2AFA2_9SPHN|nr:phosphoribosyl-AMP cyclohydrolase [Tsuneonella dongtanensis]ANY20806.1 phosphoribosyl-AMP cyclohydrolase [Tsuneonella dongtanensis]